MDKEILPHPFSLVSHFKNIPSNPAAHAGSPHPVWLLSDGKRLGGTQQLLQGLLQGQGHLHYLPEAPGSYRNMRRLQGPERH